MRSFFWSAAVAFTMFASTAQSAPVCFTDVRSWETVKAQLPAYMQAGQFYAIHESSMLIGAFKVEQIGSKFHIEAHGRHVLAGTFHDSDDVKEACVETPNIKVKTVNGGADTLTEVAGGLKIRGYRFTFSDKAGYDRVAGRVPRFMSPEMDTTAFLEAITLE